MLQNEEIILNIWGEQRKLHVLSQRIEYDDDLTNDPEAEISEKELLELDWVVRSDLINSPRVKRTVLEYVHQTYSEFMEDFDPDEINSILPPEVEINEIFVDLDEETSDITVAFCGDCLCDEEHGISICFRNRKFVGIGEYMSFEYAGDDDFLFI